MYHKGSIKCLGRPPKGAFTNKIHDHLMCVLFCSKLKNLETAFERWCYEFASFDCSVLFQIKIFLKTQEKKDVNMYSANLELELNCCSSFE